MASRTYNVDYGFNKGAPYVSITQSGSASPSGLTPAAAWTVVNGDQIYINVTGQDLFYSPFTNPAWTHTGGTLVSGYSMTAANSPYQFTFNTGLGSNSSVAPFDVYALSEGFVYWKSTLDSISATPTLSTTAVTPGSYATTSFTVSGLSTGATSRFRATGAEIKINSGSWSLAGAYALASNGDTVSLRATAPGFYDGSTVHQVEGLNAAGNGWTQFWEATTVTNPTSAYGIEVYNSSGNQTLSINSRSARFVNSGTFTKTAIAASGGTATETISITGMTDTDDWVILTTHSNDLYIILEVTKNSGSFTVDLENNSDTNALDCTVSWQVLLTG